ncbi:MAG TPA: hypothetical protein PLS49_02110 [Candidatus Woesebacteria bacterium]|nr:hypothetical protein [Candidatus Woesebacteria bacterium]
MSAYFQEIFHILSYTVAYLIGFFFKNLDIKKVKLFFVNNSIIFALILLVLALMPIYPTDYEKALQQGMFTFSSIYVAFWLAEQAKLFEERRRLKLYLGLLWQEHRFNKNKLGEIKENYRFTFEPIDMTQEELLHLVVLRFGNIKTISQKLKKTIYDSFISSGAIISINNNHFKTTEYADEVFNTLETSYNNLEYLESQFHTISLDFQTKLQLHATIMNKFGNNSMIDKVLEDMKAKVKDIAKEIVIAYRTTVLAEAKLDECLTNLHVTTSESSLREDVLLDDDRTFIEGVTRSITKEEIENPFATRT